MSRTIVTAGDLPAGGRRPEAGVNIPADTYVDKLLKMIPADIVAVWISLRGILAAAQNAPAWLSWFVFIGLLVQPFQGEFFASNRSLAVET